MKKLSRNHIILLLTALLLLCSTLMTSNSYAKAYRYLWTDIKQVEVTAYRLNVRTGPSTSHSKITQVKQGQKIDVMGTLGAWYVVQLDNDTIGCISSTYTRVIAKHNTTNQDTTTKDKYSGAITTEEQNMINLINAERQKAGLPAYKADMELMRVARIKAEDMVANQYFSHDSPVYGSPFQMLKSFKITYSYAGENIAGNSTVEGAHQSLMNSSGHKANILSSNYEYVGIGIHNHSKYGKVFVQMFIKK